MICRSCLQRASALGARKARVVVPNTSFNWTLPIRNRPISSTATRRAAAAAATAPAPDTPAPASETIAADAAAAAEGKQPLSSCPEGTVLFGLNYIKNKSDPVALADEAYPAWLWRCLDVKEDAVKADADDAADEYSKSKKQRRLAAKRQRTAMAKLLASGNLEALVPKVPLQQQTINLPANEEGTPEGALAAHEAREELRRAMRSERKSKIKESNYLKSM